MTPNVILLGFDPTPEAVALREKVQALAPDRRVVIARDWANIQPWYDSIEIAAGWLPRDRLYDAPRLRWMQQWSAGTDWLMGSPGAAAAPFVLSNASGVHAEPISEHIFAFLLAIVRHIPQAVRAQQEREWRRPGHHEGIGELKDKVMALIGVGAIGQRTAEIAQVFGMRVIGVRRHPERAIPGISRMHGTSDLLAVLPSADFVVITAPLTHETEGMIGEHELRAMKDAAWLVNIGRGQVIREDDLIRALQEGWIAGAALDCFTQEPLPADSPLWRMDNVLLTGHYSGRTPRYEERAQAIFLDNLQRYLAGRPLRNLVDKAAGY